MDKILQQIINGLSIGSVYALMAVGYSLVYSIMNFSNFAHGSVVMLGSYFGFFSIVAFGIPWPIAFAIALLGTGVLAILIEAIAYKSLRKRKAPFLFFIISAMGVSMCLDNFVIAAIGPTPKKIPTELPNLSISIGSVNIQSLDLYMLILSAVSLAALIVFIDKTKMGKAIQAAAYNMKASALMGINTDRVIAVVFLIGGVLAGLAGVFYGMKYQVSPTNSASTIKSFIAAVFGGLGSLPGAVLGSVLLGLIEVFSSEVLSTFKDLIAFVLLLVVLVVRPSGIMGKNVEDKA
jgi:branched-chain amino acid transport system permease protein